QRLVVFALLRPAEMGQDENPCILVERITDRRQGRTDPGVARDHAALYGNVEVFPDEDPLVAQVRIRNAQNLHDTFDQATVVSIILLEKPHSLSYQAQTFTRVPSMTFVRVESNMDECESWLKSIETSGPSL